MFEKYIEMIVLAHLYKEESRIGSQKDKYMNIMLMRKMHKIGKNILFKSYKKVFFEQNMNRKGCISRKIVIYLIYEND